MHLVIDEAHDASKMMLERSSEGSNFSGVSRLEIYAAVRVPIARRSGRGW
ncbi:hypothetical protein OCAR_5057 [Afipia carboxidovorans OM5]|nr:hypothetical protein OCAR_5057 [Afipia carboxidovorans OM5]